MKRAPTKLRIMLTRAALPSFALMMMAFFGVYAVLGTNGMLAYGDYKRQVAKRQEDLAAWQQRQAVLRNRVGLLDPRHANPDLVDELTRKQLSVVHPDEVIVPLR